MSCRLWLNDISNKCVLSSRLKDATDEAVLVLTGNVFHAEGPATVKERSPNLDRVCGMSSRRRDDDLTPARRATLDTGMQQLLIYSGARLFSALKTMRHSWMIYSAFIRGRVGSAELEWMLMLMSKWVRMCYVVGLEQLWWADDCKSDWKPTEITVLNWTSWVPAVYHQRQR